MKKRLKKKYEDRKRQMIHEALDMVLDINGLGARKVGKTGNLPTAFFGFRGHIGTVEVEVIPDGWSPEENIQNMYEAHTYREGEFRDMLEELKNDSPAGGAAGESR